MTDTKGKTMHLMFRPVMIAHLTEMAQDNGMSVPEIIRTAIEEKYSEHTKKKYGYKGASLSSLKVAGATKRMSQSAVIEELKAMDDAQLTQHLLDLDYFKADEEMADMMNVQFQERIQTDPKTSQRYYVQQHFDLMQKKVTYSRIVFTLDELIKDLIKERKI